MIIPIIPILFEDNLRHTEISNESNTFSELNNTKYQIGNAQPVDEKCEKCGRIYKTVIHTLPGFGGKQYYSYDSYICPDCYKEIAKKLKAED